MLVVVGSTNSGKIQATKNAFSRIFSGHILEIIGHPITNAKTAQPIGEDQIISGAVKRVSQVDQWMRENLMDKIKAHQNIAYCVGIEAGLLEVSYAFTGYLGCQYCAIRDFHGHQCIGSSPGWEYPPRVITPLLADRTLEMGDIMKKISGDPEIKVNQGAIGFFTRQIITRLQLTELCVMMALIPFLNPIEYFKSG
jgi:inosine/xanthosine triphosphatase